MHKMKTEQLISEKHLQQKWLMTQSEVTIIVFWTAEQLHCTCELQCNTIAGTVFILCIWTIFLIYLYNKGQEDLKLLPLWKMRILENENE